MENTPLYKTISSIENPSNIETVILDPIDVVLHVSTKKDPLMLQIEGLAKFHTVEDLHRAIWLQTLASKKDYINEVYPKYSFLGVEEKDGTYLSAMGTFMEIKETGSTKVNLPNPERTIRSGIPQDTFVDANGDRKPVTYYQRGRVTLEDVFLRQATTMPTFHIYSLKYLLKLYKGAKPISQLNWNGLFYPYFPALESSAMGVFTPEDVTQAKYVKTYIEAKLSQVNKLEALLEAVSYPELKTTAVKLLTFQWAEKVDIDESMEPFQVDMLFYKAPVNSVRPYMRLLSPNATPMTKLYKPNIVSPPQVSDPTLLRGWVDETLPILNSSFLISKILLRKEEAGLPPIYGTLRVSEDGTSDFIIQPPKNIRSLSFQRDLVNLANTVMEASNDMPFKMDAIKLGRANLSVELQLAKIPPKEFRAQLIKRIAAFNTLFQMTESPKDESKPILSLRYKAISNFYGLNEDKIVSYLNYVFNRSGVPQEEGMMIKLVQNLASEFQISYEEAQEQITKYIGNGAEHTIVDSDGKEFLTLQNPGIDISIYSIDARTFSIHFYNLRSITIDDFLRTCSILGLLFYTQNAVWDEIMENEEEIVDTDENIEDAMDQIMSTEKEIEDAVSVKNGLNTELGLFVENGEGDKELEEAEEAEEEFIPLDNEESKEEQIQQPQEKQQEKDLLTDQKIIAHKWFIDQLQKLDPVLFSSKKDAKSASKKNYYSAKCAANEDRQPAVLTQSQFQTMMNIYSDEKYKDSVGFIIYGDEKRYPLDVVLKEAKNKHEQITVLKYGSDVNNLHYYLCSAYFCLRDKLPVLESDWKKYQSCPFCQGTLITDRKNPEEGQTVIKRMNKPKSDKPQLFVRFIEGHPEGYGLPCCYTVRKDIGWMDPHFKEMRDAPTIDSTLDDLDTEKRMKKQELQESLQLRIQQRVDYHGLRYKLGREYILGSEKYPLEPGKIGIPSIAIDTYFGQKSSDMVSRISIQQKFKPNAQGFFRIGVLNTPMYKNQSLFAALAPLLGRSSIEEVQQYFKGIITPLVFLGLNFGNLLLEFFHPNDEEPSETELHKWVLDYYQNEPYESISYEISRHYRSYHRFMDYIDDPTQQKELRHFAHLLAEIGISGEFNPQDDSKELKKSCAKYRRVGLTLITLEYQDDPRNPSTDVILKCPMLGFDMERYSRNNVGFLTVSKSGIWEPLLYVSKINKKDTIPQVQEGKYILSYSDINQPNIVELKTPREDGTKFLESKKAITERYDEFVQKCSSIYRGAFTFQSGIDNRTLMPITRALELLQPINDTKDIIPTGVVRDIYNHLIAITVKRAINNSRNSDVLIPVVDDGNPIYNNKDLKIHLGLQSIGLAPANDVYYVYETVLKSRFGSVSSNYLFSNFIKVSTSLKDSSSKIIGFVIGVPPMESMIIEEKDEKHKQKQKEKREKQPKPEFTITMPCGDILPKKPLSENIKVVKLKPKSSYEFEYTINRKIILENLRNDTKKQTVHLLEKDHIEDIYQQLRISFGTWIATRNESGSGAMRQRIDTLLERNDIPSWEKIRRLQVEFGGLLESWFAPDPNPISVDTHLLRHDCVSIKDDEEKCKSTKTCKFYDGSCRIHTPYMFRIRNETKDKNLPDSVNAVSYLSMRLFDEIIRIPAKREELFRKGGVKRIKIPSTNVQIGSQWFIPENIPVWYDLLRETKTDTETPQYYEEFSREDSSELLDLKHVELHPIPERLKKELKPEAEALLGLRLVGAKDASRTRAILGYLGMKYSKASSETEFDLDILGKISCKYNNFPVIQILVNRDPIGVLGRKFTIFENMAGALLLVPDYKDGPAIVVHRQSGSDITPRELLTGTILDSITVQERKIRRPLLQGTFEQNSNTSNDEAKSIEPILQKSIEETEPEPEPEQELQPQPQPQMQQPQPSSKKTSRIIRVPKQLQPK